jgi:hypothetical protein
MTTRHEGYVRNDDAYISAVAMDRCFWQNDEDYAKYPNGPDHSPKRSSALRRGSRAWKVHGGRAQPRHTGVEAQPSNSRPPCISGDVQISLLDSLCCKMAAVHGQLSARSEGGFSDRSHTAAAALRPRKSSRPAQPVLILPWMCRSLLRTLGNICAFDDGVAIGIDRRAVFRQAAR